MALAGQEARCGAGEELPPLVLFTAIRDGSGHDHHWRPHAPRRAAHVFKHASCDATGYAREEVIGRNCRFLQREGTDEEAVAQMQRAIAERQPVAVGLFNDRRRDAAFLNRVELAPVSYPASGIDA